MALNLEEIERRLDEVELPDEIRLSPCAVIKDVRRFFASHIAIMRSNSPKYIKDLHEARIIIAGKAIKKYNEDKKKKVE